MTHKTKVEQHPETFFVLLLLHTQLLPRRMFKENRFLVGEKDVLEPNTSFSVTRTVTKR